jgi:LacI family transcriptional regulator
VSRVVNGVAKKASPETAARVWAAVHALGYRPMSVGQTLRQRQSRLVALLAANLANPAMAAIAASVEAALRSAGLVMVLCDTHDRADLQDEYLLEMRAQLVRATVLLGAVASPQLTALTRAGDTLLFVGRRSPAETAAAPACFIGIDNRRAGMDVAALLRQHGVTAPGLIHGPRSSSATADRINGFLAAQPNPASVRAGSADGLDHVDIGYRCALDVLGPEGARRGVFCASDLIAYGAHRRLVEAGLQVPRDVILVGFDDNPLNDWVAPWLSSVRVPYGRFGPMVADALVPLERGEAVREILPHQLVPRGLPLPEHISSYGGTGDLLAACPPGRK